MMSSAVPPAASTIAVPTRGDWLAEIAASKPFDNSNEIVGWIKTITLSYSFYPAIAVSS